MKRNVIPYGTIFANGYKIKTLIEDDYHDFDFKKFEVNDGTTVRKIST